MNLLNIVKDQISGPLASSASGFLGESESNITSALGGIMPGLLGKVSDMASNESGAQGILDMAKGVDTGMLDNISGLFGGGGSGINALMNSGGGMVDSLLGGSQAGFLDKIVGLSGISKGSAGSLLKMAAPMLMGLIGKQAMSGGLNASGLMSMLGGQKSFIQKMLPSGMGSVLGLGAGLLGGAADAGKNVVSGAANMAGDVAGGAMDAGKKVVGGAANLAGKGANVVGDVAGTAAKTGGSMLRWLLPLLLVLGVLGFFGLKTGCSAVDDVASKVSDTTKNVATGAADMAKDGANAVGDAAGAVADGAAGAAGAVADGVGTVAGGAMDLAKSAFSSVNAAAKKTLDGITMVAGSAGDQMVKFVEGGFKGNSNFRLKNANFATGSSALTAETKSELNNVVAVLSAYDKVNLNVSGYTDNTGNAASNVKLSDARANSVLAYLVSKGVNASRVNAKGYGADNPVASNETADGRAQNRRIELSLRK